MAQTLEEIVNFSGNMYEITNACVRRAHQIADIGDDDLEIHSGKVVSTALDQIFTRKVTYQVTD